MMKKITAVLAAAVFGGSLFCMSVQASQYTSYTWEAGEYWVNAGEEFCIEPLVYCDPGDIMAVQFDLKTSAVEKGAIMLTEAGDGDGYNGTAYPSFANMMFNLEDMHAGGSDSGMGMKGVPAAEDGSTLCSMWYAVAEERAVISAADSSGITIKHSDEKNCWYYAFPLEFDPSINEAAGSPMCEAVLTDESSMKINYVSGSINIIISDEAAAIEAAKTTSKADNNSGGGDDTSGNDSGGGISDNSEDSITEGLENIDNNDNISGGDGAAEVSGGGVSSEDADGAAEDTHSDTEAEADGTAIDEDAIELEEIVADSEAEKKGSAVNVIVFVIAGIAVLVAAGGVTAAAVLRKKK